MRGFLKSGESLFQLAPKVTTIGREGCDLNIPNPGIDYQHAVVEFNDLEQCYVLEDLNTSQGTYVNGCKVQNAAVRLTPGDSVQFGYSTSPYTLEIEQPSQMSYPPVHRQAWSQQPLTLIADGHPSQVHIQYANNSGLPQLNAQLNGTITGKTSRPPAAITRPRPMSATFRRNEATYDRGQNGHIPERPGSGFAQQRSGPRLTCTCRSAVPSGVSDQPSIDHTAIRKKEEEIRALSDQVQNLNAAISDISKKDELIYQLREEIAELQMKLRRNDTSKYNQPVITTTDPDLAQRLAFTENELQQKRLEIQALRIELQKLQDETPQVTIEQTECMRDSIAALTSLRTELEKVKKERNITNGLVTQMQRDMSSKDTTISRLSRDLEAAKKDNSDKDVQIKTLQTKWQKTAESKDKDARLEATIKELTELKVKLKAVESTSNSQKTNLAELKEELEKKAQTADSLLLQQKTVQSELDKVKASYQDLERAERMVRVDLEQLSKRFERLKQKVVQTTFSTPGFKAPTKELQDDEIIDELKKVIDDRTRLRAIVQDLQDQYQSGQRSVKDQSNKVKQQVSDSVSRLKKRGFIACHLKQEAEFIQTITADEEAVAWVKGSFLDLIHALLKWEEDIESVLTECDINIKLSEEPISVHVRSIFQQFKSTKEDLERLRGELSRLSQDNEKERLTAVEGVTKELEQKHQDQLAQHQSTVEETVRVAVEEAVAREQEVRNQMQTEHEERVNDYEHNIESLKKTILDMQEEQSENKSTTQVVIKEVEDFKKQIEELNITIAAFDLEKDKIRKDLEIEVEGHKEQNRQHSVTICALEERLNKVMKKNKDYQSELSSLKQALEDSRKKPSLPPKPQHIPPPRPAQEIIAMETLIEQLRRDNQELHRQTHEQQEVIVGLRRDLAGASARLTDMTGELSESQKQEMERHKHLIKMQDTELTECRQQLAKLSQIVDQQATEITQLNHDLTKQNDGIKKQKLMIADKDVKLKELHEEVMQEKDANKKNLSLLEEEGRISTELTALGAQCRGERHEQVINRQREALAELRSKVRQLEQTNPVLPSSDQALQQVVILKQELAELRAAQARNENLSRALSDGSVLAQQVSRARGIEPQVRFEGDMERSAHRETLDALEDSEQTYLSMLRSVAGSLELDDVPGLRSMAHIPRDERERVVAQRDQSMELVGSRIRLLKERIQRKDELLQGYERDLAKLRQAEQLADHKHSQVEMLSTDLRGRSEELDYMRETLQRTKDRLEQERRLNSAIKQKKTFHVEKDPVPRGVWSKHKCFPDDPFSTKQAHKSAAKEKFKKKDYEIRVLKSELADRDHDLDEVKRRLITVETTKKSYLEPERDASIPNVTPPESVATTEIY